MLSGRIASSKIGTFPMAKYIPRALRTHIEIEPNFDPLKGRMTKADAETVKKIRDSARELGRRWVEIAVKFAPKRTGVYSQSIFYRTYQQQTGVELRGYSAKPLGNWIVEGTKPHVIRAVKAKMLRFFWEKGPKGPGIYFFYKVNHPGTKKNPFFSKALDEWIPIRDKAIQDILDTWGRTFSGE
jgi:hypothetical protein